MSEPLIPHEQALAQYVASGEQPSSSSTPAAVGEAPSALSGWSALKYAIDTVLVGGLATSGKMRGLVNQWSRRG